MTRTAVKPERKQDAGAFHPVIDRNRCEGKGPCVTACPNSVLAISTLTRDEKFVARHVHVCQNSYQTAALNVCERSSFHNLT
jgi:NAD-dependent dihydropyrimidine dehydrogenase PreA subunit